MRIRLACAVIFMFFLSGSYAADGTKSPHAILVIGWFPRESMVGHLQGIAGHLARHGFLEGRDYTFEYHQARTAQAVAELLAHREPGFIVYSTNTSPAGFVMHTGTRAPHVFLTYSDPVQDGWIASYAHPGGTATGVVEFARVHEKRLDLLTTLATRARRIAVMVDGTADMSALQGDLAHFCQTHQGVRAEIFPVAFNEDARSIARRLAKTSVDAAYVPLQGQVDRIVAPLYGALAIARIPAISERRADVDRGAVLAFEVDRNALRERIAGQLARILRGDPPGDIPVHSPRKFMLTVNLDAAYRLGLDVPRALLMQADRVVLDGR